MLPVCAAMERARCVAACSNIHFFLANLTCRHTHLFVADIFNQIWVIQDVHGCIAHVQCTNALHMYRPISRLLLSGVDVCMSHGRSCGAIIFMHSPFTPVLEHAITDF